MNFDQLSKNLRGWMKPLPPSLAESLINEALEDIYSETDWGFLKAKSYIRTPKLISGNCLVTKFSEFVTLDATSKALVDAITVNDVSIKERQFRVLTGKISNRSYFYNILDYDSVTGILTLDQPFWDEDNASIKFEIFKSLYNPAPVVNGVMDFLRLDTIISPTYQKRLHLDVSLDELNAFDSTRNYAAEPSYVVSNGVDGDGNALYEFYPAPKDERIYQTFYQRKGSLLVNETDTPNNILSSSLILTKAKYKAYEWAIVNIEKFQNQVVGRFLNSQALLMNPNLETSYPALLQKAKKLDEERNPKSFLESYSSYSYANPLLERGISETLVLNY